MVTQNKYSLLGQTIFFLILMFASICCHNMWKDDKLSILRREFAGKQLRIDGYFFQQKDGNYFTMYSFYRNGVVLYLGGGYNQNQITDLESRMQNGIFYSDANKFKNYWGVLNIEGKTIAFERWYPSDPPLKAYVREGEILNDTTFIITKSYRMQGGKKTELKSQNEVYHFKHFSPKPDSTNSFVQ